MPKRKILDHSGFGENQVKTNSKNSDVLLVQMCIDIHTPLESELPNYVSHEPFHHEEHIQADCGFADY
jgi:hypothetical protein